MKMRKDKKKSRDEEGLDVISKVALVIGVFLSGVLAAFFFILILT